MQKILRNVGAASAALFMAFTPVAAFADTIGVYQTTDRKMDYELRMCGDGMQDLCVKLTRAVGSALTPQTKKFLGKDIVSEATPAGKNTWKGSVQISGYTMDGTLKLTPGKKFVMSGCVYVFACSDFTLIPAKTK
jgi:uncharacterized protein (DUF2147 family)